MIRNNISVQIPDKASHPKKLIYASKLVNGNTKQSSPMK